MRLGEPDEAAAAAPSRSKAPSSSSGQTPSCSRSASGRGPSVFSWIDGVELEGGRVVVDPETGRTGNPKYYAAGDVTGGATVVEAVRGAKRRRGRALEVPT